MGLTLCGKKCDLLYDWTQLYGSLQLYQARCQGELAGKSLVILDGESWNGNWNGKIRETRDTFVSVSIRFECFWLIRDDKRLLNVFGFIKLHMNKMIASFCFTHLQDGHTLFTQKWWSLCTLYHLNNSIDWNLNNTLQSSLFMDILRWAAKFRERYKERSDNSLLWTLERASGIFHFISGQVSGENHERPAAIWMHFCES